MFEFIRNAASRRQAQQDGASAVEYGLLVAGIAGLVVAIVFIFGGVVRDNFKNTCQSVKNGGSGTAKTC